MSASAPRQSDPSSGRAPLEFACPERPDAAALLKSSDLAEAAALVRCSRAHLSNVVNGKVRGIPRLPAVRIGRRVLFRRESLELWLQQVESATPARPSL